MENTTNTCFDSTTVYCIGINTNFVLENIFLCFLAYLILKGISFSIFSCNSQSKFTLSLCVTFFNEGVYKMHKKSRILLRMCIKIDIDKDIKLLIYTLLHFYLPSKVKNYLLNHNTILNFNKNINCNNMIIIFKILHKKFFIVFLKLFCNKLLLIFSFLS